MDGTAEFKIKFKSINKAASFKIYERPTNTSFQFGVL